MHHFYEIFDTSSQNTVIDNEYLSEEGRIHYDYNGSLPVDDDAADHIRMNRRIINATF